MNEKIARPVKRLKESPHVFINPFGDFAFKRLFATKENKLLAISLLNALFEGEKVIEDITLSSVERSGATRSTRKIIYDAEGETSNNELVIIEMQNSPQSFLISRNIYYAAANLHGQLSPVDHDFKLKELICVCFTNFIFDKKNSEQIVKTIKFIVEENNEIFYNRLTFKYVEFPKFNKKEDELKTMLDRWLFALVNMPELLQIPLLLQGDEVFEMLFRVAQLSTLNKQEMTAYEHEQMDRMDYNRGLRVAEETGERRRQLFAAKVLKKAGTPVDLISESTGLSKDEIQKLYKRRIKVAVETDERRRQLFAAKVLKEAGTSIDLISESIGLSKKEIEQL